MAGRQARLALVLMALGSAASAHAAGWTPEEKIEIDVKAETLTLHLDLQSELACELEVVPLEVLAVYAQALFTLNPSDYRKGCADSYSYVDSSGVVHKLSVPEEEEGPGSQICAEAEISLRKRAQGYLDGYRKLVGHDYFANEMTK